MASWKKVLTEDPAMADLAATGTASASTFLRGDGSWNTPSSGSNNYLDGVTVSGTTVTYSINGGTDITSGSIFGSNAFNSTGFTTNTGTLTAVSGTAPVVSSGGTTPAISMAAATASANGYLTSSNWSTFNNKGSSNLAIGTTSTTALAGNTAYSTLAIGTTASTALAGNTSYSTLAIGTTSSTALAGDTTTITSNQATNITNTKSLAGTNETNITTNIAAIALNTTHRNSSHAPSGAQANRSISDSISTTSSTTSASSTAAKAAYDRTWATVNNVSSTGSYAGGTSAGPVLTFDGNSTVTIPSASATASGIVTAGTQRFAGNKTFDDGVVITGNLTVNGSTTTVNTAELSVEDKNIELASGATQASHADGAGLNVKTSSVLSTSLKWIDSGFLAEWAINLSGAATNLPVQVCMEETSTGSPSGLEIAAIAGAMCYNSADGTMYMYL